MILETLDAKEIIRGTGGYYEYIVWNLLEFR